MELCGGVQGACPMLWWWWVQASLAVLSSGPAEPARPDSGMAVPRPSCWGKWRRDRNQGTWAGLGHTARCLLRCLPGDGLEKCGSKVSVFPSIQWDSCCVIHAGPGQGAGGVGCGGGHRTPGLVDRM